MLNKLYNSIVQKCNVVTTCSESCRIQGVLLRYEISLLNCTLVSCIYTDMDHTSKSTTRPPSTVHSTESRVHSTQSTAAVHTQSTPKSNGPHTQHTPHTTHNTTHTHTHTHASSPVRFYFFSHYVSNGKWQSGIIRADISRLSSLASIVIYIVVMT